MANEDYWDRFSKNKNEQPSALRGLSGTQKRDELTYLPRQAQQKPPQQVQQRFPQQPQRETQIGLKAPSIPSMDIPDTQKIMDESLKKISDIASGKSEYMDFLKNKYLGLQGAGQVAQKGALEQQLAGSDFSESAKQTQRYLAQRSADTETTGLMGELFEQESQMAQGAQSEAFQMAMQSKQLKANDMKEEINALMAGGGVDNLHQASKLMEQLYGVPIDLHNARQQNIMATLGGLASTPGMSIDEVLRTAEKTGDLKYLGMTKEEARRYIEPIMHSNNPIYIAKAEYGDLLESGEIDEKEYDKMVKLITWQQTNPEGIEIFDSYRVTDNTGNEIGNFKTEEEANNFASKEGGRVEFTENGYIDYEGKYDEYLPVGEGELFETKSGELFIVQNGEKVSATPDWDDPFSMKNEQLMEYYEMNRDGKNAKIADKILETQFRTVINNPMDIPENIATSSPLYQKLLETGKVKKVKEFGDLTQVEEGTGRKSRVKIPTLEGVAMNTMINAGGRIYVYRGDTPHAVTGDDDYTEYELYDVSTGESVFLVTSFDPRRKGISVYSTGGGASAGKRPGWKSLLASKFLQ